PHGPYVFGGVCMGGLVAWEMARRLTRRGRPVAHLVIIDTWAAGSRLLMTSGQQRRWLARHVVRTVRWRTYLATLALLRRPLPPHRIPALRRFIHNANAAAVMRYRPGRCAVPTTFVLARDARIAVTPDPRLEFASLADGPTEILASPGDHESVCHGDNVPTLAATLRRVLDGAEGAHP
ncbi:MAG: hypothetical protein JNJ48_01415, partial [Phycisphaerae bacterium]|nr:hypothetical protein [Phycisphaerae bacterium]